MGKAPSDKDSVMNCPPVELLEQKLSAEGHLIEGVALLCNKGATEEKKLHRLSGKSLYKFGKLPTNDVVLAFCTQAVNSSDGRASLKLSVALGFHISHCGLRSCNEAIAVAYYRCLDYLTGGWLSMFRASASKHADMLSSPGAKVSFGATGVQLDRFAQRWHARSSQLFVGNVTQDVKPPNMGPKL
eukprot:5543944-Amphidinium_carterae.1